MNPNPPHDLCWFKISFNPGVDLPRATEPTDVLMFGLVEHGVDVSHVPGLEVATESGRNAAAIIQLPYAQNNLALREAVRQILAANYPDATEIEFTCLKG